MTIKKKKTVSPRKVSKTYREINEKIQKGKAVVLTAEEMIQVVEEKGATKAAREVDVVTTGTFGPMCSSGAFLNFGHSTPKIKAHRTRLNNVPCYSGVAAVDIYSAMNIFKRRSSITVTIIHTVREKHLAR